MVIGMIRLLCTYNRLSQPTKIDQTGALHVPNVSIATMKNSNANNLLLAVLEMESVFVLQAMEVTIALNLFVVH